MDKENNSRKLPLRKLFKQSASVGGLTYAGFLLSAVFTDATAGEAIMYGVSGSVKAALMTGAVSALYESGFWKAENANSPDGP